MAAKYWWSFDPLFANRGNVSFANSLDPNETPWNSASHPNPSCLSLRQSFHQVWSQSPEVLNLEADENGSCTILPQAKS